MAGASAGTGSGTTPNSPAATPAPANQQTTPTAPTADSQLNAALNTYLNTLMMRATSLHMTDGMQTGMSVGIDTCSAVHMTTREEDLIKIDKSEDSMAANLTIGGVGEGGAKLTGVGLWLIPLDVVYVPRRGGRYDAWEDAWLGTGNAKSTLLSKPQPRHVRVLSDDMLEQLGIFVRNGIGPKNESYLICKKTGCMIPLHRENGLLVIKTRKQRPNAFRSNTHVHNWTERLPSMLEYRFRGDEITPAHRH